MTARDDYKRCVCDQVGNGESDCPQSDSPGPDPSPPTPPTPGPEPPTPPTPGPDPPTPGPSPDVWRTWASLQEIRDTPHYSETSYSRTLYQVDREVDFLEAKLVELYTAAIDGGLIQ